MRTIYDIRFSCNCTANSLSGVNYAIKRYGAQEIVMQPILLEKSLHDPDDNDACMFFNSFMGGYELARTMPYNDWYEMYVESEILDPGVSSKVIFKRIEFYDIKELWLVVEEKTKQQVAKSIEVLESQIEDIDVEIPIHYIFPSVVPDHLPVKRLCASENGEFGFKFLKMTDRLDEDANLKKLPHKTINGTLSFEEHPHSEIQVFFIP